MPENSSDIRIVALDDSNANTAFNLVSDEFSNGSVLHQALHVSADEYRNYLQDQFFLSAEQGLSLIAIDNANENILGCLIACDFLGHETAESHYLDRLKPLVALLKQLESEYLKKRQFDKGVCMLVDLAVVSKQAGGRGIYRRLREAAHEVAKESGFKYVVGELSSAATQHVCVKRMGQKVMTEIDYASFEYAGRYPFAKINQPASIQLVEYQI